MCHFSPPVGKPAGAPSSGLEVSLAGPSSLKSATVEFLKGFEGTTNPPCVETFFLLDFPKPPAACATCDIRPGLHNCLLCTCTLQVFNGVACSSMWCVVLDWGLGSGQHLEPSMGAAA